MKTKLILTLASMLLSVSGLCAATPYAVYCEGDHSLHFLMSENEPDRWSPLPSNNQNISNFWVVNLNQGTNNPSWNSLATTLKSIERVVFEETFKVTPTSCYHWFYDFSGLKEIENLDILDTSAVTDMQYMFGNCSELISLDLSSFNTSQVTEIGNMFNGCTNLVSLNLSSFNTSNVKNMGNMFFSCKNLEKIYVSDTFTINNGTTGSYMFYDCEKLRNYSSSKIDKTYANYGDDGYFTYFKPCAVFDSESKTLTFKNASPNEESIYTLNKGTDVPEWSINNASTERVVFDKTFEDVRPTSCYKWFSGCTKLTIEGLENLNTTNVTNINNMFADCDNLRLVDLTSATEDCSNVANIIPQNALVYVPENTVVDANRANVVVGKTCAHFVINFGDVDNNQNLLNIPHGFTATKVTINRNFTKDFPHSLFLPFAISVTDLGTFYTYVSCTETSAQFEPVTETTTTAHTPYMFIPAANCDNIVIVNVDIETTPANVETDSDGYIGVYEKKTFTKDDETSGLYYGWANNEFRRAGNGASVDACRAYLKLPSNVAPTAPSRIAAKFGDNVITGISDINSDDTTTDSPSYNLNGQRVSNSYRGILIKDGKKIINTAL